MTVFSFHRKDVSMIFNLFKMYLRDRYMGSSLGLVWAIINPLLFLGLYTFIFGFIFKAKVPGAETTLSYAIFFICGFVPYLAISESMSTTTTSIIGSASMVKNIVFTVECLPVASALTAMVPLSVGMVFLMLLQLINGSYPTWHIIFLIPVIMLQFAFLIGLGFFLSATTVFIRDIAQIIPTIVLFIVFFTPIFYSPELLPSIVQKLTFFNPFHHIIKPYRDIILSHQLPEWEGIIYMLILTTVINVAGLKYFRRLKGHFVTAL